MQKTPGYGSPGRRKPWWSIHRETHEPLLEARTTGSHGVTAEPDPERCAKSLRDVSREIAKSAPRSASDDSVAGAIDRVRAVSAAAANTLRSALAAHAPDVGWLGEDAAPGDADYWLSDPIDGAYHYLQGLPLWSSSLVLVRAGRPVLSVVHDPTRDELFVARAGSGATCNGDALRVSPKSVVAASVVGTAIPPMAQVGQAEQDEALAMLSA